MQKTAYEVRISDWSSDVCSSDLIACRRNGQRSDGVPRLRAPATASLRQQHGIDHMDDSVRLTHVGEDRKSVELGKSVSVRVAPGGRRIIKKQSSITSIVTGSHRAKQ